MTEPESQERYRRVKELFLRAEAVDPEQRQAFIAQESGGDAEVCAEVLDLLAWSEGATGSLSPSDSTEEQAAQRSGSIEVACLEVLERLGDWERFTGLELIGRGGMGLVFRAHDPRLKRYVALKFLQRRLLRVVDPALAETFRREAELQARVAHPAVLEVYETGEAAGLPYIAMKYVAGPSLLGVRRETTREQQVELLASVAEGVHAAHCLGLIHRDLKPGNILVERTASGELRAFVSDFGIAEEVRAPPMSSGESRDRSSRPEAPEGEPSPGLFGSPWYMAPELLAPEESRPDVQTDLFSLGVTFYEFLSGRHPFAGESTLEVVRRIREGSPAPLSEVSPETPPEVSSAVMRCLEKQPRRRHDSARALAEDLRGGAAAGETRAPRGEATPFPTSPGRRFRSAPVIWLTVVLASIVAVWVSLAGRDGSRRALEGAPIASEAVLSEAVPGESIELRDRPARESLGPRRAVAVAEMLNLSGREDEAWLATALSEMLTSELSAGGELRLLPPARLAKLPSLAGVQPLTDEQLEGLRRRLGADVLIRGAYLGPSKGAEGQLRLDLRVEELAPGRAGALVTVTEAGREEELSELVHRAGVTLRQALSMEPVPPSSAARVRASFPRDPVGARLYAAGLDRLRRHDAGRARGLLMGALESSPDHPLLHLALSRAYQGLGNDARSATAARRAFDLSQGLSWEQRLEVEAHYRQVHGQWDRAVEIFRSLWDLFPDEADYGLRLARVQIASGDGGSALETIRSLRQNDPRVLEEIRTGLVESEAFLAVSDYGAARDAAGRVRELASQEGLPGLAAEAIHAEARSLRQLGDLEGAVRAADEARATFEAVEDRRGVALALSQGAVAVRLLGRYGEARRRYGEALAIYRELGFRHGVSAVLNNEAGILREQGELDEAMERYEESLAISREIGNRKAVASTTGNLGLIHYYRGEFAAARDRFQASLAGFRAVGDRKGIAAQLTRLSAIQGQRGRLNEAAEMVREALEIFEAIGSKGATASAHNGLGYLSRRRGELALAEEHHRRAFEIYERTGNPRGMATSSLDLGLLELLRGAPKIAKEHFQAVLPIAEERGLRRWSVEAFRGLGRVALLEGRLDESGRALEKARDLAEELGSREEVALTRMWRAHLLVETREPLRARAEAEEALRTFQELELPLQVASARRARAEALLALGLLSEAGEEIAETFGGLGEVEDRVLGLSLELLASRVALAEVVRGGGDVESVARGLERIAREAEGFTNLALEARLAALELELEAAAGEGEARRVERPEEQLRVLELEAEERSLGLVQHRVMALRERFSLD